MFRKMLVIWILVAVSVVSLNAFAEVSISNDDYVEKYNVDGVDQSMSLGSDVEDTLRSSPDGNVKAGGLNVPETSDMVTVESDGAINVATEDGVDITVYPPFGMMAFTQDLMAQLDVYAMLDDPVEIIESLKEMGVHIYMVDLVSEAEVYVSTSTNIVSSLVNDLDELSEADLNELIKAIGGLEPNAVVSSVTCGAHRFLVYDYRNSGAQVIIYTGIKNNTNIDFQYSCNTGEIGEQEIQDIEYLLNDVRLADM